MKKNSRKKGAATARGGDGLLKVLMVVLAVILVIMVLATMARINRTFDDYTTRPNNLLWTMKNGYYGDAVNEMYDNIVLGETVKKNADYEVPYALLEYYEAESYYTAYTGAAGLAKDPSEAAALLEDAEKYKADMEDARGRMGDLEFMTEEIDAIFAS